MVLNEREGTMEALGALNKSPPHLPHIGTTGEQPLLYLPFSSPALPSILHCWPREHKEGKEAWRGWIEEWGVDISIWKVCIDEQNLAFVTWIPTHTLALSPLFAVMCEMSQDGYALFRAI